MIDVAPTDNIPVYVVKGYILVEIWVIRPSILRPAAE